MIGRVFEERYEVMSKLGTGGMADVYLAKDLLLGREVALKILSSKYAQDEQFVERFRREASSAAGLNHPNIVQIYDRGETDGTYFIAMEVLQGRSLKQVIVKYAPLSPDLIVSISTQILEALRFAHRRDIIHRDIKPQNIVIDGEGRVKVTDFGIARAGGSSTMTEAGSILGTAHYLSPEQAAGKPVEAASDLYSLGVVMYEMATGKLPFQAENAVGIAMLHINGAVVPPREIVPTFPENLEAVILRALGKKPTERYLTADAFLDDLKRVQQGEQISPPPAYLEGATRVMAPAADLDGQRTQIRRRPTDSAALETKVTSPPNRWTEPPEKKRRAIWPIVLMIVLVLALAGGAYAVYATVGASSGQKVDVPDLTGMTETAAKAALSKVHLKLKDAGTEPSSTVAAGNVVRQDPVAGASQADDSTVSVWLSSGIGKKAVPDVVGKNVDDATKILNAADFKVLVTQEASNQPVGTVIRQNPAAEAQYTVGQTVTIFVASPANMVDVPNVVDLTQAQAETNLTALGLVPVVQLGSSSKVGGTVFNQDPAANTSVLPGSKVTIFVSDSTTVVVPSVTNMSLAKAQASLQADKLGWTITYVETPDSPAGTVVSQNPIADTIVEQNTKIQLTVAKAPATTTTSTTVPSSTTTTTAP